MSWFARSITNTLSLDGDEEEDQHDTVPITNPDNNDQKLSEDTSSSSSPRGVKQDLSELTKNLTRQLWGVASFLAPPPQPDSMDASKPGQNESDPDKIAGIRTDLAEIGGRFKSGISKLSENIKVSDIKKMASDFLQLADDDNEGEGFDSASAAAVGISEQVVAFARDIAMHPETWLDFPLPEDEDDDEDFEMSDPQQEHALAVERLAPGLAALRIELCPGYISEAQFWKIYFVLLHPRLDKHDAVVLSTPQIMKARASLAVELQKRKSTKLDRESGEATIHPKGSATFQNEESLATLASNPPADVLQTTSALESATSTAAADSVIEKQMITSTEIPVIDKPVIEEVHVNKSKDQTLPSPPFNSWEKQDEDDEDDNDDWLKDESSGIGTASGTTIPLENEEDVSFSDLEDDNEDEQASFNKVNHTSDKGSRDWVEL